MKILSTRRSTNLILKGLKRVTRITALLILTLALLSALARAEEKLPLPVGLINDFAGIISPEHEEKMNLLAREVLYKTGATVTVVTLKDIGGANVDEFTNRLYEKWGVGKKGEDRGVMLLIALKERRLRIEVGYGLEGIIPDGLAGQIRDKTMVRYLKKGDYGLGLLNGLSAVASIIAKDRGITLTGLPPAPKGVSSRRRGYSFGVFPLLFFVFVFWILARSGRRGGFALLPLLFLGGGRGGSGGHGGFGGGFGGFGGGMSGGGGASGGF
ncbi:MAG TPA: TPM domain-containing protein [Desulfatiglandales bacterium]|nr:TPM domain-containing protein [Desulfatiglandales bacterium]